MEKNICIIPLRSGSKGFKNKNIKKINKIPLCMFVISETIKSNIFEKIFIAIDEKVKTVGCSKESKKGCNGKSTKCITHNLWDELELHINTFFENKKLSDLTKINQSRIQ